MNSFSENKTARSNRNLAGKVAFVTGAANGIGCAAALAFALEGDRVGTDRTDWQT